MKRQKRLISKQLYLLGEIGTGTIVSTNKKLKLCIVVPETQRDDIIYFKVYNNENPKYANRCTLINMRVATTLYIVNHKIYKEFNQKQKEWIYKTVQAHWSEMHELYNSHLQPGQQRFLVPSKVPDYRKMPECKPGIGRYVDFDNMRSFCIARTYGENDIMEYSVYRSKEMTICLHPHFGYNLEKYFIVFDSLWIGTATKMARISVDEARYIYTEEDYKKYWHLSENEKEKLIAILSKDSGRVWKNIFFGYSNESWEQYDYETTKMPDYHKLPKQDGYEKDNVILSDLLGVSSELGEDADRSSIVYYSELDYKHIVVMPSEPNECDPYFIITDFDARHCILYNIRINMLKPEYVICTDDRRKFKELNENEKNWLLELLSDVTNNDTLWRNIIRTYNVLRKGEIISEDTPIPDYKLL